MKDAPRRIQRKRTAGATHPANTKHCTRPGKFGNPFTTAAAFRTWLDSGEWSASNLRKPHYKNDLNERRQYILEHIKELRQYDYLACFCEPDADCHVDVILERLKR